MWVRYKAQIECIITDWLSEKVYYGRRILNSTGVYIQLSCALISCLHSIQLISVLFVKLISVLHT